MLEELKRSITLETGIYQFEFTDNSIAVAKWDQPPSSSNQWVNVSGADGFRYFYFEGTCVDDIRVVPADKP